MKIIFDDTGFMDRIDEHERIYLKTHIIQSVSLGKRASNYFSMLSKKYPLKRRREIPRCNQESNLVSYLSFLLNDFIINRLDYEQMMGPEVYQASRISILHGMKMDCVSHCQKKPVDQGTMQSRIFNFKRSDDYAVREVTHNYVQESSGINDPFSLLIVENLDRGIKLELNQLLPEGSRFSPSCLRPTAHLSEDQSQLQCKFFSIEDYPGSKFIEDKDDLFQVEVYFTFKMNDVVYGNIVKRGGMFSLLHEIAHQWHAGVFYSRRLKKIHRVAINRNLDLVKLFLKVDPYQTAQDMILCEKKAWEDAYFVIGLLRDQGIDLEPEMGGEELCEYANFCLETYDKFAQLFFESLGLRAPW